jgi:hypothetical protein
MSACAQCGMETRTDGEYHPYAACLMFSGCHDGDVVRANLDGVVAKGAQYDSGFDDMADRIAELEAALREIADFAEQFIGDDEDGDERMYKVHQIADNAIPFTSDAAVDGEAKS